MSIKLKILLSFLIVAFSIGLLGALTFLHDVRSAERVARHEATNIAHMFMLAVRHDFHKNGKPLDTPDNQQEFQHHIEQYKELQPRDIVIIDKQMQIVADTIVSEVGKTFTEDQNGEVRQTLQDGKIRFFVEQNESYPLGIKQLVIPFDSVDGERIGAIVMEYTPLYNELMAGIKGEAQKFLLFFALALLLALVVGYSLSASISGALLRLQTAALDLANGKLNTRVETEGPTELSLLATSFNAMAENLENSHTRLQLSHRMLETESSNLQRSEADLRRSEEKFRILFESANVGILQVSGEGQVVALNDSFANLHGYSIAEMMEMNIRDLDTPESAKLVPERIQRMLAGEKLFFEVEHYCKNGQIIPLEVSANMVTINNEKSILGFHRDITNRRRTAQERKELRERLQQAQKMEAIGTLSGGIAHDFNNILSAINGFSQLALMRSTDDNTWQEDIRQVLKAAGRATDLVRQILTFSRKQQQEKVPIQISTIVKEALKLLRASIPSTIDIRQEIISQATVMADPTQIHQVVMNLCTNAYHAMVKHGGVLSVTLKDTVFDQAIMDADSELPPGRYVTLSVSDTGYGMTSEIVSKIFDPYFTTKETGKGTGMGLAVVYGIVKSHQGMIAVQSEPDKGATFTVSLPIIASAAPPETVDAAPPMARAHERVMVVDDESDIRECTSAFLAQAGYQVKSFGNGVEAWKAFSQAPGDWDIIITDKTMPKMTGEQLAAMALEVRPDLPVILCSGYHTPGANGNGARLGGVHSFLQKPIDVNTLLTTVAKALAEKSQPLG